MSYRPSGRVIRLLSALITLMLALSVGSQPIRAQAIVALNFDQPATGQITHDTFRQVYSLAGRNADVITLNLAATSGTLDPLLILTDDQGALIARANGEGQYLSAAIQALPLPHDGTYFVIATRFGQDRGVTVGGYTLTLTHVGLGANTGSASVTPIRYNDSPIGQIDTASRQLYAFSAQRGDLITITMQRISGDLDSYLILTDAQGHTLATSDDDPANPGTLDAAIRDWLVRATDDYQIIATRFGQAAGTSHGAFVLSLTRVSPDQMGHTAAHAILLDYGASAAGTIDNDTLMRYYQFEAHKGDVIALDMERTRGNLDPTLTLATPDSKPIVTNDQGQRGQSARLSAYTVAKDGTYLIIVSRYNGDQGFTAGDFTLTLTSWQGVTVGAHGTLILAYGGAVTSTIDSANPSQQYTFPGKAGDLITATMNVTAGNLEAFLVLEDSHAHILTAVDLGTSQAQIARFKLPANDTYVLIAARHGRAGGATSGNYILTLSMVH
ncbi:MAG: pre-peptidase C-terminal domain-containing protein [Aggregatilineales bacterium]